MCMKIYLSSGKNASYQGHVNFFLGFYNQYIHGNEHKQKLSSQWMRDYAITYTDAVEDLN